MREIIDKINKFWPSKIGHLNENQRDKIIQILLELKPAHALEIGFAGGRHTVTTLIACPTIEHMMSIDVNFDYQGGRSRIELIKQEFGETVEFIEKDSCKFLSQDFENRFDYIFVDGCHSYDGAKCDMQLCYPKLNIGGVMIVDDYMSGPPDGARLDGVKDAVDDFVKENNLSFETWNVGGKGFAIFTKSDE